MRLVVVADTHIAASRKRELPLALWRAIDEAGCVLHAGDVTEHALLAALAAVAPTYAVLGNNDHTLQHELPTTLELVFGGVRIGMVHDSGLSKGRERRVHRRFPTADLVVYGHSHQPELRLGVDGQRLFNPGSPTERRQSPACTYGIVEVNDGEITRCEVVAL